MLPLLRCLVAQVSVRGRLLRTRLVSALDLPSQLAVGDGWEFVCFDPQDEAQIEAARKPKRKLRIDESA